MAGEGAGDRERERERDGAGEISIKSDTECIDKDPNSGSILGNNFKLHLCMSWESRGDPNLPPSQHIRFQIVTHFTISLNALENRIRAQARDGIRVTLKNIYDALLLCPAKPSSVFHSKSFAGVPGSIHFSLFCFLLLYP